MSGGLKMRDDLSSGELRRLARRERGRTAARMYAIANALDGMSRAESARVAGMERQALRDAVVRYNAEGVAGLTDRPKGHRPRRLTEGEEATLAAVILRYIFSAVRPATGDDFTLVLPEVSTRATRLFFDAFAETPASDTHAVVVLDGAGWHQLRQADLPSNITLVSPPPYRDPAPAFASLRAEPVEP